MLIYKELKECKDPLPQLYTKQAAMVLQESPY